MKNRFILLIIISFMIFASCGHQTSEWIRINQLGYRPSDVKIAVLLSKRMIKLGSFKVIDIETGKAILISEKIKKAETLEPFVSCYCLDLTDLTKSGTYKIVAGRAVSPVFRIGNDVYDGTADFLLNYMRQQRSGYNPYLRDSCHTYDGYRIYGKPGDSTHINVSGGWHDAADYLQYVATSANATYQMLFAFTENPSAFGDNFLANGLPGSDGVPDVLNESLWGLDWLMRMNPSEDEMYNQIADDRDHIGFRFPVNDTASYGKGKERPVYLCTGEPQGLFKYKNRTTGVASTAGKFASSFAKGSEVLEKSNPELSDLLLKKAVAAFNLGLKKPGVCQTAPGTAPYFYEEDNWVDDMELAAIELYNRTKDSKYLKLAIEFGRKEPVTPWMGSDTARHYQWYPFINMGHPVIARHQRSMKDKEFAGFMKEGLERIRIKGTTNPFQTGIPFIWCSNNLIAATVTQAHLYSEITGDNAYAELEAAHRDWLFGCNPWGTSMIVGLPENGDYPVNSHSSYVVKGGQVPGGLIDGPVYPSIFNSLKYIYLSKQDEYAEFQTKMAVYHDDYADYSTNECTMDGTASLVYYLSSLASMSEKIYSNRNISISRGAVVRMDTTLRNVYLCFTAHDFNDGFDTIIPTLSKNNIKASFFFTGDFCRTPGNEKIITKLIKGGHYIGPHSDKHLLYCSWENRDSLLVTKEEWEKDIVNNFIALERYGISKEKAKVFLPPYEWHNDSISVWSRNVGLIPVNISSGTITNQDWTFPEKEKPYFTSDSLMKNLVMFEKSKGMNGYILLIHPGTDPRRTDKFYFRLDSIIHFLQNKKYTFHSFSEIKS
jgi:endoglucanase